MYNESRLRFFYICPSIVICFLAVTDIYDLTEGISLQKRNYISLLNVNNPYGDKMVIFVVIDTSKYMRAKHCMRFHNNRS